MSKSTKIPMYHPWRKDADGKPLIQQINPKTVNTGKASKMGYTPVPVINAAPHVIPTSQEPIAQKAKPANKENVKNLV